mgnify:CR=1 FL=1
MPADVKTSVECVEQGARVALRRSSRCPQGGRGGGGGRGGANESLGAKLGQAKNGLMATMTPGEQTTTAHTEVKADLPKAIADLNATIAKAATLSGDAGEAYNLTLTVPEPIKTETVAPARENPAASADVRTQNTQNSASK